MTNRLMLVAVLMAGCGTDDPPVDAAPEPTECQAFDRLTSAQRRCAVDLTDIDAAMYSDLVRSIPRGVAYIDIRGNVDTFDGTISAESFGWERDSELGIAVVLGDDLGEAVEVRDRQCQWIRCLFVEPR